MIESVLRLAVSVIADEVTMVAERIDFSNRLQYSQIMRTQEIVLRWEREIASSEFAFLQKQTIGDVIAIKYDH